MLRGERGNMASMSRHNPDAASPDFACFIAPLSLPSSSTSSTPPSSRAKTPAPVIGSTPSYRSLTVAAPMSKYLPTWLPNMRPSRVPNTRPGWRGGEAKRGYNGTLRYRDV